MTRIETYRAFVGQLLEQAREALEYDDPGRRGDVEESLKTIKRRKANPSTTVLDLRFVAGCNGDSYLRDGIARIAVVGSARDEPSMDTLYAARSTAAVARSVMSGIERARSAKVAEALAGIPVIARFLWTYRRMEAMAAAVPPPRPPAAAVDPDSPMDPISPMSAMDLPERLFSKRPTNPPVPGDEPQTPPGGPETPMDLPSMQPKRGPADATRQDTPSTPVPPARGAPPPPRLVPRRRPPAAPARQDTPSTPVPPARGALPPPRLVRSRGGAKPALPDPEGPGSPRGSETPLPPPNVVRRRGAAKPARPDDPSTPVSPAGPAPPEPNITAPNWFSRRRPFGPASNDPLAPGLTEPPVDAYYTSTPAPTGAMFEEDEPADVSALARESDDALLLRLSKGGERPGPAELRRFRDILLEMQTHQLRDGGGIANTFLDLVQEQRLAHARDARQMQRAYNALEADCNVSISLLQYTLKEVEEAVAAAPTVESVVVEDEDEEEEELSGVSTGSAFTLPKWVATNLLKLVVLERAWKFGLTKEGWQTTKRGLERFTKAVGATDFVDSAMKRTTMSAEDVAKSMKYKWVSAMAAEKGALSRGVNLSELYVGNLAQADLYFGATRKAALDPALQRELHDSPKRLLEKVFNVKKESPELADKALLETFVEGDLLKMSNEEGIAYTVKLPTRTLPDGSYEYAIKASDTLQDILKRGNREARLEEIAKYLDTLAALTTNGGEAAWAFDANTGYIARKMPPVLEQAAKVEQTFVEELAERTGKSILDVALDTTDYLYISLAAEAKAALELATSSGRYPNYDSALEGLLSQRGTLGEYSGTEDSLTAQYNLSDEELREVGIAPEYAPEFPTSREVTGPQEMF